MVSTNESSFQERSEVILQLLSMHQKLHKYLDRLVLEIVDINIISALIDIRKVNVDCVTRYTDLLARGRFLSTKKESSILTARITTTPDENDMTMWNIHGQLARFMPLYQKQLRNPRISKVQRMIIAQNYDTLIKLKEQLLHPIKELVWEDHGANLV